MPRRADIASFYTSQHPEQSSLDWPAFYRRAEQLTDELRLEYGHELDLPYGPHPKQILDLYYPAGLLSGSPVLLFMHGGTFREGDPALYGYIGRPYLERGWIFGSVGYRLTPETYFPASARDIEQALQWVRQNISRRGGDPERIVLSGHSAGAMLAGHVSYRDDWRRDSGLEQIPRAAVLVSGRYDLRGSTDAGFVEKPDDLPSASVVTVVQRTVPTVIAYGTAERGYETFAGTAEALARTLRAHGGSVELLALEGLNHGDTANALADPSSVLCQAVARLV